MPYLFQPFPGHLDDVDALRRQVEEEFNRLSGAYTDDEKLETDNFASIESDITALQTADTALDVRLDKLENIQLARVGRITTDQTGVADATRTKVQFNSVIFDPSGIWDAANFRFKPTVAGYYHVTWGVLGIWASGNGLVLSMLQQNGGDIARGSSDANTISTAGVSSGTDLVHMNGTTDYLEVVGFISAAAAATRSFSLGSDVTRFAIHLVKPD